MAKTISITLEAAPEGTCVSRYAVRLKMAGESNYTTLPEQSSSPIQIPNLKEGVDYVAEITRICCGNQKSNPLEYPFTVPSE